MAPRPRRRLSSPPPSPMENDDILCQMILPRLPPQPSSLPRASIVCKRWRRLVADPAFLRRFHAHHGVPPLVGGFVTLPHSGYTPIRFASTLDPPDRIPAERFSLRLDGPRRYWEILSCRHGRLLLCNSTLRQVVAWDPLTGDQLTLAFPPGASFNTHFFMGSVVCADTCKDHVHVDCRSSPFKVVFLQAGWFGGQVDLWVYTTMTAEWSDHISLMVPSMGTIRTVTGYCTSNVLIDDTLYLLIRHSQIQPDQRGYIIEFDVGRQTMALIHVPAEVCANKHGTPLSLIVSPESGLGLVAVSNFRAQMWSMKANCDGIHRWVQGKTIELDKLLSLSLRQDEFDVPITIAGYSQLHNVIILVSRCGKGTFMVHFESMQFKKNFRRGLSWIRAIRMFLSTRTFTQHVLCSVVSRFLLD